MNQKVINKLQHIQKELLDERIKDRGDNLKKQDGTKSKNDGVNPKIARKPLLPGQGDVPIVSKVTKAPKTINNTPKGDKVTNDINKKHNENKPKFIADLLYKVNNPAEKVSLNKTPETNAASNKAKHGAKNTSDKVSLRSKVSNNQTQGKDTNKNSLKCDLKTADRLKNQMSLKSASKEIISDSTKIESEVNKQEREKVTQRKPLIKTVKSKNDNRVYKAVTFTEQKRITPTVLEINMPNIQAKKIKSKLVDKELEVKPPIVQASSNISTTKLSVKAKSQGHRRNRVTDQRLKRKRLNRCISSPDKFKKVESPPTEVAKWAPSCLNTHTKPYYEAWVNTTLAAISKVSKKDKLFLEKQNIIKTFQKSLELGTESPNLIHEDYNNESYTGRIKIKQKKLSRKTRQPLITPLLDKY